MSVENVVLLREGRPALTDIPGRLRVMADQIEKGELGAVASMFVLMPVPGGYPRLFGWGEVAGTNDPVVQIELAKLWLLNNLVERR